RYKRHQLANALAAQAGITVGPARAGDVKPRGKGRVRMRRLSIVSLCLLGTCGGGALAASTASAALPELGRCVSSPGTGGFKGTTAHCVVPSPTHTGNWEWL